MKKKEKSLKTTWSDSESDDSEDDDYINNYVVFQVTTKNDCLEFVTTNVATQKATSTNFDNVADCNEEDSEPCKYSCYVSTRSGRHMATVACP